MSEGSSLQKESYGSQYLDTYARNSNQFDDQTALVLIIDDDQFNIEIMKRMIWAEGVAVDSALGGPQALDMILNRSELLYT